VPPSEGDSGNLDDVPELGLSEDVFAPVADEPAAETEAVVPEAAAETEAVVPEAAAAEPEVPAEREAAAEPEVPAEPEAESAGAQGEVESSAGSEPSA
jgi:hypothetical protein